MSDLDQLLQKYSRPAYQAVLSALPTEPNSSDSPIASKFGGDPYFEAGEVWPACHKCGKLETFVCQLDLRHCPDAKLPDVFGLVSFFYCFGCFPWDAPHPGWTVRNHRDALSVKAITLSPPAPKEPGFLSKLLGGKAKGANCCLVNFQAFNCYPQLDEIDEIGDAADRLVVAAEDISDEYYERIDEMSGKADNFGTIVGGYSQWIQSFPPDLKCKECQGWMRQLVQIGSHREVGVMFGDAGCVYLSICEQHPSEISMMTQCF